MSSPGRWRVIAGAVVLLTALAALITARWAAARYTRGATERLAASAAAYMSLVSTAARGSSGYDLTHLLVQARALRLLAGWDAEFEVYHGTAPLVQATGRSLTPAQLDDLRRRETVRWVAGRALAPLKDRDDWDVVGAVAVTAKGGGVRVGLPETLALGALVLALLVGWLVVRSAGWAGGPQRPAVAAYAMVALLLGLAAYGVVRHAAQASTERWLSQTRLLVQEAAQRLPVADAATTAVRLGRIARGAGGELSVGDSADEAVHVTRWAGEEGGGGGGVRRAVVAARVGPGRWLALATSPAQATTEPWLALCLGLVLLGPLALWPLAWAARERRRPQRLRETLTAWGFLAPATAHLAVFSFAPILFAVVLSLHRWNLVESTARFVGVANFVRVARDPLVWISLRNSTLFALQLPVTMALALGLALVLHRHARLVRLARTVAFLPYVSSVVAIALVWQWVYHADFGPLNYLLSFVGVGPVDWLANPRTALLAVALVSVWVQVGYQMAVFIAGLEGIPQVYLDAAVVDGANAWRRFWRVTFPLLKPVTLFVLVTGIISSFQVFTYIYVLTGGGPLHATDVLVYRIYQTAWEFLRFGDASAMALLMLVTLFAVTWAQFRLLGKRVYA